MENSPAAVITGYTIPSEMQDRYNKWFDSAYAPIYLRVPGIKQIDRYRNVKVGLDEPVFLNIYHHQSVSTLRRIGENQDRNAVVRDTQTWPIEPFWMIT